MFLSACEKEEATATGLYFMRFKVQGVERVYDIQSALTAAFGNSGNAYDLVITGFDLNNSNMGVSVFDSTFVKEGSYTALTSMGGFFKRSGIELSG